MTSWDRMNEQIEKGTRFDSHGREVAPPAPVAPTVEPLAPDAGPDVLLTRAVQQLDAVGQATAQDRADLMAAIGEDAANRALSAMGNPYTATNPGPGGGGPRNTPATGGLDAQLAEAAAAGDWCRVTEINARKLADLINNPGERR